MIKKFFIVLASLIVLLVVGILIFLLTFDLNHYRSYVAGLASKTLGRTVEIQSLSTKLSLIPTIKVEGLRLIDPAQKEPVLEIPTLEAIIDLPPLIHRQIFVQKITVPQAIFVWHNSSTMAPKDNAKKQQNAPVAVQSVSKKTSQIWIESAVINSLKCSIGDKKPYEFKINKFNLKSLSKFSFDFVYLKNTVNVSGNLGSILELLTRKESLPVDLSLHQNK